MSPPPLALEFGGLRYAVQEGKCRDGVQQEVAKSICLDAAFWQLLADFWQTFCINVAFLMIFLTVKKTNAAETDTGTKRR